MSPGTIALLVVAVSVALWALFMAGLTMRKQRRAAFATTGTGTSTSSTGARGGTGAPPQAEPQQAAPEPEEKPRPAPKKAKPLTAPQMAVSRRQFLNRAWTASFTAFLGFFGMSSLSFLWPKLTGGFGTAITAGSYDDLVALVGPEAGYKPLFVAEGRFWLVYYEGTGDSPVYLATGWSEDMKLLALYRKCVHLGCSVPHCADSSLFECPCHGSKYRLSGEYYQGPAPRGLDRFPITLDGDKVMVDTGLPQTGPPRGTSTWDQFSEPTGPYCVPV
ncbi:MAG: ubiquinol-cytochrome c reductase iron-sulfur subunit [Actinomycetota bacterium]|nr:ubiquinol-cytochrome c reductase iron-sulfur subunit [Actinomycetota bacterium]